MKTIALVNNKGGQGKTTTAVNLSAFLAAQEKKTLLIDLDSQKSASLSLGFDDNEDKTIASVLIEDEPIQNAIKKTSVDNLDIIVGDIALSNLDVIIAGIKGREHKLKDSLKVVKNQYDYIFLDSPPSLSLLTINSLVASDYVLVPVTPQYLSMEGLRQLLSVISKIKNTMNARVKLLGIVFTMVDYRMKVTDEVIKTIRDHFKKEVFKTVIRQNVKLIEAPSFSKTIFDYAGSSAGAECYRMLGREVIKRCQSKN